jgi:hypothetical protein
MPKDFRGAIVPPGHRLSTVLHAKNLGAYIHDLAINPGQAVTTKILQIVSALKELTPIHVIHVFAVLIQLLDDLSELFIRAVVVVKKLSLAQPCPERCNLRPAGGVGVKVFFQLPQ